MTNKKKVIIVDDHDLIREGLIMLLNETKTIEVIAEARNGKEFLEIAGKHNPDVVLMDITMPLMDGIETTRQALSINPDLKILALSMFGDEEKYFRMVRMGAKGFVLKSSVFSELEKAILEVSSNRNYFSADLLRKILTRINDQTQKVEISEKVVASLTKHEIDVLKLLVEGHANESIVKKLNTTLAAVKSIRASLLAKTSCNNSASLVMFAIKHKIVEVD
jgi:DNA-binding NarL/FixJ family response regulator